ncbi:unnamed protein product [Paramecium sonneborni]|uniref:Transmembrane protein n=1 Tax=Paramecium sonneborni TaxID=65129 RepID=A0A8S1M5P9_9CILI|nr:unnamed protein product [Paramecium sonneborni]
MQIESHFLVHLNEDEEIPLTMVVNEKETKQQLLYPFSTEFTQLINYISDRKKKQLQDEINKRLACLDFIDKYELQNTQTLDQVQGFDFRGIKSQKTEFLNDYLPDFIYGGQSLMKDKTDFNFKKYIENEILTNKTTRINVGQQGQENIKYNVAILIYQGEPLNELNESISHFKNEKIIPIIIITSRRHFKQLFQEINKEIYTNFYLPIYKVQTLSQNYAYFLEEKKNNLNDLPSFFFAFFAEIDRIQLIRWIYLGILNFIDPEHVVISNSNLKFNQSLMVLFQLFEKLKIFGISWNNKIIQKNKYNLLCQYTQIPQNIITSHSIFKIKQFHDPLQCIYKWSLIDSHVSQYYSLLKRTLKTNLDGLGLNSILPKFMLGQQDQLELLFINQQITNSKSTLSEYALIDHFIEIRQNINNQMKNNEIISNDWIIYTSCILQNIFNKFQLIQSYFGISVCFFFSFHSSYQLLYNITDVSLGYTALAIIVPLFYSLNVLLYTLISNLYHSKEKIQSKNKNNTIYYRMNYINQGKIKINVCDKYKTENLKIQEIISPEKSLINFQIEAEQDDLIFDLQHKMPENQEKNQEIFFMALIPQYQKIDLVFNIFIKNQKILDFAVFLFTVINLFISYGENLWNVSIVYQTVIIIFAIIFIFIECLLKKLSLLSYTYNFTLLTYLWQIQNIYSKKYSAEVQLMKKKQLAEQLLINALIFYCFIAVESYFNYSGYVFVGILGYQLFVSIISGLLYLKVCTQKNVKLDEQAIQQNSNQQKNNNMNNQKQYPLSFNQQYREIILQKARFLVQLSKYDREKKQKNMLEQNVEGSQQVQQQQQQEEQPQQEQQQFQSQQQQQQQQQYKQQYQQQQQQYQQQYQQQQYQQQQQQQQQSKSQQAQPSSRFKDQQPQQNKKNQSLLQQQCNDQSIFDPNSERNSNISKEYLLESQFVQNQSAQQSKFNQDK